MHIVMFGQKQTPSREGGVEVVAEQLSCRMAARGHSVTCYVRGGKGPRDYRGVKVRPVWALPWKGASAVSASFFAALRAAFSSADVVHIHAEGPAFFCWLPKLTGKRVVVTIHGLDWQREKWKGGFAADFLLAGERMAVQHTDALIVLSKHAQTYFETTYGRPSFFLPNGVSCPQQLPADRIRKHWGLEKEAYLLFLGRLVPEKGVHTLISAFQRVKTGKKLVIAGASSDTDAYVARLRAMAAGEERIFFTGFVSQEILWELYSSAYVYVLPSTLEGMPLSLLEAMSYGNCCLVSDIPECLEAVQGRAPSFRTGEEESLRAALQTLCDDPAMVEDYRREARSFPQCNWETVTERTLEVYAGLTDQ